jgi:hypothetical protein
MKNKISLSNSNLGRFNPSPSELLSDHSIVDEIVSNTLRFTNVIQKALKSWDFHKKLEYTSCQLRDGDRMIISLIYNAPPIIQSLNRYYFNYFNQYIKRQV